jgi:hypothetical protein
MARTALAIQTVPVTGITPTFTAANVDGHSIATTTRPVILAVTNGSGSPITVTVLVPGTAYGLTFTAPTNSVAAGATDYMKIPNGSPYAQTGASNAVYVDFSAVTTVTVACLDHGG